MKSSLSTFALALGMALLAVSALWGMLFPASQSWSEEKAQRMADLTTQAHGLLFKVNAASAKPSMHSASNAAEVKEEYDKVKAELELLRVEFEGKRDAPDKAATILRWSGIAFIVAGGLVVFANRSA